MSATLQRLIARRAFNPRNPRHRSLLYAETLAIFDESPWRIRTLAHIQSNYRAAMLIPGAGEYREWLAEAFALIVARPAGFAGGRALELERQEAA
jgi:hypothetical protein